MDTSYYIDPAQCLPRTCLTALAEGNIVAITTDSAVGLAGATPSGGLLGVARTATAANTVADIVTGGVARCLAGAAVTRGQFVTSDATSRAVPVTLAAAGATYIQVLGEALESAAGAGEFFACKILLCPAIIA